MLLSLAATSLAFAGAKLSSDLQQLGSTGEATLNDVYGTRIVIPGLWALQVGNGGSGGDSSAVYFTAGIPGPDNMAHGLLGRIQSAPVVTRSPDGRERMVAQERSGLSVRRFREQTGDSPGPVPIVPAA